MDVFICHSGKDIAVVKSICALLDANEITYWLAEQHELAGGDYIDQINAAIDQSQMLLMLGSQNAMTSDDVMGEIQHAKGSKTPIIPVKLGDLAKPEEAKFEYIVGLTHFLTYAPTEEFSRALLTAISAHRKTPLDVLKFVALKKYANRKFGWWPAAIALVAVVALLVGLLLGRTPTPQPGGGDPAVTTTTTTAADNGTTTTTPAPTTTTTGAVPQGENEIPPKFDEEIANFDNQGSATKVHFTKYIRVGDEPETLNNLWTTADCYSGNTAVVTIDQCKVTAVSKGETFVVIWPGGNVYQIFKIIVY